MGRFLKIDKRTRVRGTKPLAPELHDLHALLLAGYEGQQKVNSRGGRLVYLQSLRYAAQRLYEAGWRVTRDP